jgi:hypothetical protein
MDLRAERRKRAAMAVGYVIFLGIVVAALLLGLGLI